MPGILLGAYLLAIYPLTYLLRQLQFLPEFPVALPFLLAFPFACIYFTKDIVDSKMSVADSCVYLAVLYILLVAVFSIPELSGYSDLDIVLRDTIHYGVFPFIFFSVLKREQVWWKLKDSKKALFCAWLVLSATYFLIALYKSIEFEGALHISNVSFRYISQAVEQHDIGYLLLGDTYALLSLLILAFAKRSSYQAGVFTGTLYVLLVIGSRASFNFFIAAAFIAWCISNLHTLARSKVSVALALIVVTLAAGLIAVVAYGELDLEYSILNTMISPFRNYDGSLQIRQAIQEANRAVFLNSPLTGDYQFEIKLGRPGTYTHNILSYWEEYGLPLFLLIVATYFYFLIQIVRRHLHQPTALSKYALLVIIYWGFNALLARGYVSPFLWFAFAVGSVAIKYNCMLAEEKTVEKETYVHFPV